MDWIPETYSVADCAERVPVEAIGFGGRAEEVERRVRALVAERVGVTIRTVPLTWTPVEDGSLVECAPEQPYVTVFSPPGALSPLLVADSPKV